MCVWVCVRELGRAVHCLVWCADGPCGGDGDMCLAGAGVCKEGDTPEAASWS